MSQFKSNHKSGSDKRRVPSHGLIRNQVKAFKEVRPNYVVLTDIVEAILKKAAKLHAPLAIVQKRTKKVDSFAEKITRKWEGLETEEPVTEFTDLCGGRIITLLKSHSDAVCRYIEKNFDVDSKNCVNAKERLGPAEFGYLSRHYIVSLRPGKFTAKELGVPIPKSVYPTKKHPMKAEIQVRTILEHAYADVTHDLCYKSSFDVPDKWLRKVGAVAAALETTSDDMEAIVAGIQDFAANYGGTLTPDQTNLEIEKLETVLKFDRSNVKIASRIAHMAITLGDWDKALQALKPYLEKNEPAVWRDYGVALVKKHRSQRELSEYRKGQEFLEKAADPKHKDSDAMAAYASSWRRFDTKSAKMKVREWYKKAYESNPGNAYALANVLELEIVDSGSTSAVKLMRPVIEHAIQRGLGQAEVGTNHPWAYYNAALFSILLNEEQENPKKKKKKECISLGYLAKAIACSNARFMLESACRSATRIENAVSRKVILGLSRRLLSAGASAKRISGVWGTKPAKDADCSPLAPSKQNPFANHEGRIIIIAGDCGDDFYGSVDQYRETLIKAFNGYRGIIISGGTMAGVAEVAGDIAAANRRRAKVVGYLPSKTGKVRVDTRYSRRIRTSGNTFSAEECLQYWHDILAAGTNPSDICVIGIGGGDIAAVEYRIALAFGAKVAVFKNSGRSVKELLEDVHWKDDPNLFSIPEEEYTFRYLVQPSPEPLPAKDRVSFAKAIHKFYQKRNMPTLLPDDPARQPWSGLIEDHKKQNLGQVDDMATKLSAIGCRIVQVQDRKPTVQTFSDSEIDRMAQMEHGRWNAQKLLDGWRHGDKKDADAKTNPCLVPWDELPKNEQQKDTDTVKEMPHILAASGFEVQRI